MVGKKRSILSADDLFREALANNPHLDINSLHEETYRLMLRYKSKYYESKVDAFLSRLDLPLDIRQMLRERMLEPVIVTVKGIEKEYSNFMEEASRRVSQAFQPISGKLAELCAERELSKYGLVKNTHFTTRKRRTDITLHYPDAYRSLKQHRVEIKNVKIRERATRGLLFDGDSLFGFFNDLREFTPSNVEVIDDLCEKTGGYCYLPPDTLAKIQYKGRRLKPNILLGQDMSIFVRTGKLP